MAVAGLCAEALSGSAPQHLRVRPPAGCCTNFARPPTFPSFSKTKTEGATATAYPLPAYVRSGHVRLSASRHLPLSAQGPVGSASHVLLSMQEQSTCIFGRLVVAPGDLD